MVPHVPTAKMSWGLSSQMPNRLYGVSWLAPDGYGGTKKVFPCGSGGYDATALPCVPSAGGTDMGTHVLGWTRSSNNSSWGRNTGRRVGGQLAGAGRRTWRAFQ